MASLYWFAGWDAPVVCELHPARCLVTSTAATSMTRECLLQLSSPVQYNSVRDTFLLSIVRNRRNLTLNSRPAIFRLFSETLRRSWEVIESTQCRWRWATSSTTDADVTCLRHVPTTAGPRSLLLTKRCHYALPSTPSCRDSEAQHVVDATLSLTSRLRQHAAVFDISPTTCPDATPQTVAPTSTGSTSADHGLAHCWVTLHIF